MMSQYVFWVTTPYQEIMKATIHTCLCMWGRGGTLRAKYYSTIAIWAIQIKCPIAQIKF